MKINFLFNNRYKVFFFIYFIIITTASLYILKLSNIVIADLTLKSDYKLAKNFNDNRNQEIQLKFRKFLYENINSKIVLNNYKKNTIKGYDFNKNVYGKSIVLKLKFKNSFNKIDEKHLKKFLKGEIKIFQLSQIDNFNEILKNKLRKQNNGNIININAFYGLACIIETTYCLKGKDYVNQDLTQKKILFTKIFSNKNLLPILLSEKIVDSFMYDFYISQKYALLDNGITESIFVNEYFDIKIKDYTSFNKIILLISYIFFLLIPFFIKRFND